MSRRTRFALVFVVVLLVISTSGVASLDASNQELLTGLTRTVNGQTVGPEEFTITEERIIQNAYGVSYRRVEAGLSGSIDGYTCKPTTSPNVGLSRGANNDDFTDAPDFRMRQEGNTQEFFHGIGKYYADEGSGFTFFLPDSAENWNGKMYVIAHGAGSYGAVRELVPREPDIGSPHTGSNTGFVGLLIDKGYAVAYTRRLAGGSGLPVTLDDGTILENKVFGHHVGLIRDYTLVAKRYVESQLGREPDRTYFWGKSAGASLGQLINYLPGGNLDAAGQRVFDGLINNDPGGGWQWPILYVDGKDVLFRTDADKENFVPQINVAHLGYVGNTLVVGDYPVVKRQNARILNAKGLGSKSRTYEVVGVSHSDAGSTFPPTEGVNENIELGGLFDALFDILDRWVEQGIEPPPTRSDAPDLGDADRDGYNENPAIRMPEVACPTGVYYLYPEGCKNTSLTGFAAYLDDRPAINHFGYPVRYPAINALINDFRTLDVPFDENWLEPLNQFGYPVDMNGNGTRDTRDTITEAWQRRAIQGYTTGTLGYNETLTHAKYVSAVSKVASDLHKQEFLTDKYLIYYIEQAIRSNIGK